MTTRVTKDEDPMGVARTVRLAPAPAPTMRLTGALKCPECGGGIIGSADLVPGCARMTVEPDGAADWAGGTEMFWDGQYNRAEQPGTMRVQCAEGHEWDVEYAEVDHLGGTSTSAPARCPRRRRGCTGGGPPRRAWRRRAGPRAAGARCRAQAPAGSLEGSRGVPYLVTHRGGPDEKVEVPSDIPGSAMTQLDELSSRYAEAVAALGLED